MNKENIIDVLKNNKYSYAEEANQIIVKLAKRFFFVISNSEESENNIFSSYLIKGYYARSKHSLKSEYIISLIVLLLAILFAFLTQGSGLDIFFVCLAGLPFANLIELL
jgi:delta-aminolevulinic acid dehydratase/porphobilinogen synthase